MLVKRAFKFRLYPTKEQATLINKTMGCSRFVFNHFLAHWNNNDHATGQGLSYYRCATSLPSLKKTYTWLQEVDSIALQSAVRHLADAYHRFFNRGKLIPLGLNQERLKAECEARFSAQAKHPANS